jgi:hypothetical protein
VLGVAGTGLSLVWSSPAVAGGTSGLSDAQFLSDEQLLAIVHELQKAPALALVEYALGNLPNLIRAATKFDLLVIQLQRSDPPWCPPR